MDIQAQPTQLTPHRRGSSILFWYVTREFLLPLACCLLAFTALFVINSVFDDLPDFLSRPTETDPGSRWQILWYFILLQPANMLNVLPMSVLLASCFMTSMMGKHHELAAIRAAGIPLTRVAIPVWVLAFLISASSFWVAEVVVPLCTLRSEKILSAWTDTASYRRRQAKLAYHNAPASRDWFFQEFDPGASYQGVFIKQFGSDGGTLWELQARSATYSTAGTWIFNDCTFLPFDPLTQLPIEAERKHYTQHVHPKLDETPARILNHVRPADKLSVRDIWAVMKANPDLPDKAKAAFESTLWYRFSFPFASLLAALLGVSLAITRERSSALRGFAYAVGLMVAYYVVGQFGLFLARSGYLPAFVGGACPSLLFVTWGVTSMFRKR